MNNTKSKENCNAKFTRQELEVLEIFTEDDIKTILEYQEKLPILVGDNDSWIDAYDLWQQLHVKKKYSTWITVNLKDFEEFEDYKAGSPRGTLVNNLTVGMQTYYIKLSTAKEIAMFSGRNSQAGKELKDISKLCRRYFILMEKAVQKRNEWLSVRNPEKYGYKVMDEALDRWTERNWHHKTTKYEYATEADTLNEIVLGMKSKDKKMELGITSNEMLRDYLHKNFNEQLSYLQDLNTQLLNADYKWSERVSFMTRMYNAKFGNKTQENVA